MSCLPLICSRPRNSSLKNLSKLIGLSELLPASDERTACQAGANLEGCGNIAQTHQQLVRGRPYLPLRLLNPRSNVRVVLARKAGLKMLICCSWAGIEPLSALLLANRVRS